MAKPIATDAKATIQRTPNFVEGPTQGIVTKAPTFNADLGGVLKGLADYNDSKTLDDFTKRVRQAEVASSDVNSSTETYDRLKPEGDTEEIYARRLLHINDLAHQAGSQLTRIQQRDLSIDSMMKEIGSKHPHLVGRLGQIAAAITGTNPTGATTKALQFWEGQKLTAEEKKQEANAAFKRQEQKTVNESLISGNVYDPVWFDYYMTSGLRQMVYDQVNRKKAIRNALDNENPWNADRASKFIDSTLSTQTGHNLMVIKSNTANFYAQVSQLPADKREAYISQNLPQLQNALKQLEQGAVQSRQALLGGDLKFLHKTYGANFSKAQWDSFVTSYNSMDKGELRKSILNDPATIALDNKIASLKKELSDENATKLINAKIKRDITARSASILAGSKEVSTLAALELSIPTSIAATPGMLAAATTGITGYLNHINLNINPDRVNQGEAVDDAINLVRLQKRARYNLDLNNLAEEHAANHGVSMGIAKASVIDTNKKQIAMSIQMLRGDNKVTEQGPVSEYVKSGVESLALLWTSTDPSGDPVLSAKDRDGMIQALASNFETATTYLTILESRDNSVRRTSDIDGIAQRLHRSVSRELAEEWSSEVRHPLEAELAGTKVTGFTINPSKQNTHAVATFSTPGSGITFLHPRTKDRVNKALTKLYLKEMFSVMIQNLAATGTHRPLTEKQVQALTVQRFADRGIKVTIGQSIGDL